MKNGIYIAAIASIALFCCRTDVDAVEIKGTVRSATAADATIAAEGEFIPNVGDPVQVFFKLSGTDSEISVGTGKVSAVKADFIEAKIDKATGSVGKDQLVRITSQNPQNRSVVVSFEYIPPTLLHFDGQTPGPLPADWFADEGIHFVKGTGTPGVYKMEPNMVGSRKHVLLVAGDRVTSLSVVLDRPVRRFGFVRIGTVNGASIPTWSMVAYDQTGNVAGRAGEEHGLSALPKEF